MGLANRVAATVAALVLSANAASATTAVDVDNLVLPPAGTEGWSGLGADTFFGFRVGQSWTAGISGKLATIELVGSTGVAGPPHDFDVTLSVFRGFGGAAQGSEFLGALVRPSSEVVPEGITAFDFSALAIDVMAGQVLTWEMSVANCDQPCAHNWSNTTAFFPSGVTTPAYAGGSAYGYSPGIGFIPQLADGNFRISVLTPDPEPGIPEPATWAMLIIGFAAAGVMLRSRGAKRPSTAA